MGIENGNTYCCSCYTHCIVVQDLSCFVHHFHFFLCITVVQEGIDVRQTVGSDGVRVFFRCFTFETVFQIFPTSYTRAGNCLICGVNYTFDFVFVIQRFQGYHRLDCGAVRVSDDIFVPVDIFGIYFGNNQRNVGVHSPLGAVVDYDTTVFSCDGSKFFGDAAACGEQCDIDGFIERMFIQFFYYIFFTIELQCFACGTCRSHYIEVFDGELSFFQNFQESSTYHTCCANYGKIDFFHLICPSFLCFWFYVVAFPKQFFETKKSRHTSADFQGNCGRMLSQFDCFL